MATSQVIDNDLSPKWDEDFKLLVHEPDHQVRFEDIYSLATLMEQRAWIVKCSSTEATEHLSCPESKAELLQCIVRCANRCA
jgi:hypothetical protein